MNKSQLPFYFPKLIVIEKGCEKMEKPPLPPKKESRKEIVFFPHV
jgi:hypothetical protein